MQQKTVFNYSILFLVFTHLSMVSAPDLSVSFLDGLGPMIREGSPRTLVVPKNSPECLVEMFVDETRSDDDRWRPLVNRSHALECIQKAKPGLYPVKDIFGRPFEAFAKNVLIVPHIDECSSVLSALDQRSVQEVSKLCSVIDKIEQVSQYMRAVNKTLHPHPLHLSFVAMNWQKQDLFEKEMKSVLQDSHRNKCEGYYAFEGTGSTLKRLEGIPQVKERVLSYLDPLAS